jgi:hypothetical protein
MGGVASATLGAIASACSSRPDHTPPLTHPAISASRSFPLAINPDPVSLGVLNAGQAARAMITLRNPGPQPVSVERIETGCSCLRVGPAPIRLGPGESAALTVAFDPSHDPDFRGMLSIDVDGHDATGSLVFRTCVNLVS